MLILMSMQSDNFVGRHLVSFVRMQNQRKKFREKLIESNGCITHRIFALILQRSVHVHRFAKRFARKKSRTIAQIESELKMSQVMESELLRCEL